MGHSKRNEDLRIDRKVFTSYIKDKPKDTFTLEEVVKLINIWVMTTITKEDIINKLK